MNELFYPTAEMKKSMYEFYCLTYESTFSLGKKRHLMTATLGYEKWAWRVVGITKQAVFEISNNKYKRPKGLQRDHFKKSRKETYDEIFQSKKLSLEEWWEKVWENDETILMTKNEHQNHKKIKLDDVIKVDYTLGYFRAGGIGMLFTKRDGDYVKMINEELRNE
jgi:hypothetical protein